MSSGTIMLRRPRVRGVEERFESRVLPLFARRTKELGALLPELYRSSPELCVKVRGSSSMLLLGCLGDLLRFEKREIQVATFAPDRSSP